MAIPIRQLPSRRVISFLGRKKDFVLHTQNNEKTGTQPRETFWKEKKLPDRSGSKLLNTQSRVTKPHECDTSSRRANHACGFKQE
jgi:hypothetical protein